MPLYRIVREIPPISSDASSTIGFTPVLRRNSSAAVNPAGPAPITIAFFIQHTNAPGHSHSPQRSLHHQTRTSPLHSTELHRPSLHQVRAHPQPSPSQPIPPNPASYTEAVRSIQNHTPGAPCRCLKASPPEYRSDERLRAHLAIARLDHSIKNLFVLPGVIVPLSVDPALFNLHLIKTLVLAFIAITLVACSNYVINEVLDAPFDRLHPIKKNRPAARGLVSIPAAYIQWLLMMIAGVAIGLTISKMFALMALILWIMGCIYNFPPIRTKDVPYLDVLTESINNPSACCSAGTPSPASSSRPSRCSSPTG